MSDEMIDLRFENEVRPFLELINSRVNKMVAEEKIRAQLQLTPFQLTPVVHLKHYLDRYPICWPMTKSGVFRGSDETEDVTCSECIDYIKEYL